MKIVADKNIPLVEHLFSKIGDVHLADANRITAELVRDADVLLVRTVTPVCAELLDGSKVTIVGSATSGTDHVDQEYLHDREIELFHSAGANARAVAEYVLSALCMFSIQDGFDLRDKRVGIVGYGNTGSQLGRFLSVMDSEFLVNDPPLANMNGDGSFSDLSEVLQCDIISLHVPLIDTGPWPTRHLVDENFLEKVKPDVILINTSRGQVVDEEALLKFMDARREARIVLDVWKDEPNIRSDLLTGVAIGTPHIAGYSLEGKIRATELLFGNICKFIGYTGIDVSGYPGFNGYHFGISLAPEENENETLCFAVLAAHDIRSDSAALRRSVELPESSRGEYFEDMRRAAMLRREFSSMTVRLPAGHSTLRDKLEALGFEVAEIT